jgi:hypothetical protein
LQAINRWSRSSPLWKELQEGSGLTQFDLVQTIQHPQGKSQPWTRRALYSWLHIARRALVLFFQELFYFLAPKTQSTWKPPETTTWMMAYQTDETARREVWLLAESWWAKSFRLPSYFRFVRWLISVIAWIAIWHVGAASESDVSQIRRTKRVLSIKGVWWSILLIFRFLQRAATLLFLCLLIIPILAISWLPFFRHIMKLLVDYLGDSYAAVADLEARQSILAQMQRDIEYVAERSKRVAIVAHSQGAMLSRHLLEEWKPEGVHFLAGLGSGLGPLHALQTAQQRKLAIQGWKSFVMLLASFVTIVIGQLIFVRELVSLLALGPALARSYGAAYKAFSANPDESRQHISDAIEYINNALSQQSITTEAIYMVAFFFIGFATLGQLSRTGFSELIAEWRDRLRLTSSKPIRWIEYSSRGDPVSSGRLLAGVAERVVEVANGPSVLMEHIRYWKNAPLFLDLANELTHLLDPPTALCTPEEYVGLVTGMRQRVKRIRRLIALRSLLLYSIAAMVVYANIEGRSLLGANPWIVGAMAAGGVLLAVTVSSRVIEAAATRAIFERRFDS